MIWLYIKPVNCGEKLIQWEVEWDVSQHHICLAGPCSFASLQFNPNFISTITFSFSQIIIEVIRRFQYDSQMI